MKCLFMSEQLQLRSAVDLKAREGDIYGNLKEMLMFTPNNYCLLQ